MPPPTALRFKIVVEEGPAHGDLYELEQTTYFRVVDTRTNAVVLSLQGEMSARYDGVTWSDHAYSGVREIIIAADERTAQVHHHDGRVEVVPLPV